MSNAEIMLEIMDYCDEIQNYSYYELDFYAQSNKPLWAEALKNKNFRKIVATYLSSCRRECKKNKIPHPSLVESLDNISKKISEK